jgi:ATP-dependent exoDNAse (exonuclease V) alpha subunit
MISLEKKGIYDPIRDTAITATNGKPGSRGAILGQGPVNEHMALQFNPDAKRFLIDAGRERRNFAVGDKVMATKNDHDLGITNGMTGVVTKVAENESYLGDWGFVGEVESVKENIAKMSEDNFAQVNLDDMFEGDERIEEKEKDKAERGEASHTITVEFPGDIKSIFSSYSEVMSLQLAYVITCHKSQGGEYPFVIIMVHNVHKFMMYREWLYTAVTRSSEKVLLMVNEAALAGALRKQKIKGSTLKEKAKKFLSLSECSFANSPELPEARTLES